ncbi:MAG: hypothetical protein Q9166_006668 [cf. Caloplaca sp. 2 TL-2023]
MEAKRRPPPMANLHQLRLQARPHQGVQRPIRRVKEPLYLAIPPMLRMLPRKTGLAVGGVYLKRYIHRRRDAQEAALAGPRQDLQSWGPGQSVHEFNTPMVVTTDAEREKGKDVEMVQSQEGANDRRNSRRLKKLLPGRG